MTQLGLMVERGNKLKTYPLFSSSVLHKGIPNREAPLCLNHQFHRPVFGEDARIGQISESLLIGGSECPKSILININMGKYFFPWRIGRSLKPADVSRQYTWPQ